MKVKEVIKFECWIDEMRIWTDTYAENVYEIEDSELPTTMIGPGMICLKTQRTS